MGSLATPLVDGVAQTREGGDAGGASGRGHALGSRRDGTLHMPLRIGHAACCFARSSAARALGAAHRRVHPALGELPRGERFHGVTHAAQVRPVRRRAGTVALRLGAGARRGDERALRRVDPRERLSRPDSRGGEEEDDDSGLGQERPAPRHGDLRRVGWCQVSLLGSLPATPFPWQRKSPGNAAQQVGRAVPLNRSRAQSTPGVIFRIRRAARTNDRRAPGRARRRRDAAFRCRTVAIDREHGEPVRTGSPRRGVPRE